MRQVEADASKPLDPSLTKVHQAQFYKKNLQL
jgi:hypothetical protein